MNRPSKAKPKRKASPRAKKPQPKFEPDDILIKNRELFLYEAVTDRSAASLIKEIKALNCVNLTLLFKD